MTTIDPTILALSARAEDALNAALDHLGRDATAFAIVTWIDDRICRLATKQEVAAGLGMAPNMPDLTVMWALQDLRAVLVVAALMHVRIGQEVR